MSHLEAKGMLLQVLDLKKVVGKKYIVDVEKFF